MAFADWEFFNVGSTVAHFIDQNTPIASLGSLRVTSSGAATNRGANWKVTDASSIPHGFNHGKIRTFSKIHSFTNGFYVGFVFMQSQDNLTASGNFYFAVLRSRISSGISFAMELYKVTGGVFGGVTLLGNTGNGLTSLGVLHAVEVEWDASSGIQTDIIVRFANNITDFSTLATVISVTDSTAPYVTSVGEGGGMRVLLSGPEQVDFSHDTTEIFQLLP